MSPNTQTSSSIEPGHEPGGDRPLSPKEQTKALRQAVDGVLPELPQELEVGNVTIRIFRSIVSAKHDCYATKIQIDLRDSAGLNIGQIQLFAQRGNSDPLKLLYPLLNVSPDRPTNPAQPAGVTANSFLVSPKQLATTLAMALPSCRGITSTLGLEPDEIVENYAALLQARPEHTTVRRGLSFDGANWSRLSDQALEHGYIPDQGQTFAWLDVDLPISESDGQSSLITRLNTIIPGLIGKDGVCRTGLDSGALFLDARLFEVDSEDTCQVRKEKVFIVLTKDTMVTLHDGPVAPLTQHWKEMAAGRFNDGGDVSPGKTCCELINSILTADRTVIDHFERVKESLERRLQRHKNGLSQKNIVHDIPTLTESLRYIARKLEELESNISLLTLALERSNGDSPFGKLSETRALTIARIIEETASRLAKKASAITEDCKGLREGHIDKITTDSEIAQRRLSEQATASAPALALAAIGFGLCSSINTLAPIGYWVTTAATALTYLGILLPLRRVRYF